MSPVSRRAAIVALLVFAARFASAQPNNYSEGGYSNRRSAAPGESIAFHIASAISPFHVQVVNMSSPETVLVLGIATWSAANRGRTLQDSLAGTWLVAR